MIEISDGVTQKTICLLLAATQYAVSKHATKIGVAPEITKSKKHPRFTLEKTQKIIRSMISDKLDPKKKKISFVNFKGGTGKTSLSFQVSAHLALMGFRVLAVDTDPQGHLTNSLGFYNNHDCMTLNDVVTKKMSLSSIILPVYEGLDCVPSNLSMTRLEKELWMRPKREDCLNVIFSEVVDEYDYIIFDANPNINILNQNVMMASDYLCIVTETAPYSLLGMKMLMEDIDSFFFQMGVSKPPMLVIPNKYEDRTTTSLEAMAVLFRDYGENMIQNFAVRRCEEFNVAAKNCLPLAFFASYNSKALEDVIDLVKSIVAKTTVVKTGFESDSSIKRFLGQDDISVERQLVA